MSFAYDIRGVYPDEVNEKTAYNAGRAIALFLKTKKVIVGRDCRISSPTITKSLIYGLTDQGCNVIDIGYCNTPMSYYAAQKQHSLMVTASHNPKQYNGIKITRKGVESIGSHNGLSKIAELMNSCHFPQPKKRGHVTKKNILNEYAAYVRKIVQAKTKPLKILIDCGNGMAGYVVPKLLEGLKTKYKLIYGKLDGNFPNHTPNPAIPENTKDLQKAVVKGRYDLGIAYDGDCDRVYFIDEKGKRVRPEFPLLLFAKDRMKKGQTIAYTVNCSKIVQDLAKELGFKAVPSPIGHSEIPIVMKKNKAVVSGEITGHYYFKQFKYADSGDIAALMMISILSKSGRKMSKLIKPFQKYATSEELNFSVKDKEKTVDKVLKAHKACKTTKIDGWNIDAGSYWFNLRLSKTENYVRLNVEAKSEKDLKKAISRLSKMMKR